MNAPAFQPGTFRFLKDLATNNSRDWFDRNKADYQRLVKKPADAFRAGLADALADLTGCAIASKQFRINRDLRFSRDKTPYNTHIRMAFWPANTAFEGKDAQPPGFFLSIEPDHIRLGTGCMAFSKPVLGAYLTALEAGRGGEVAKVLSAAGSRGFKVSDPDLVKVPRGFPKDHPHADLARHKGLAVWRDLPDTGTVQGETAIATLVKVWTPALPVWRYLYDLQEKA